MEKLRGELLEGRAVDGKLKSSLEWPYTGTLINSVMKVYFMPIQ